MALIADSPLHRLGTVGIWVAVSIAGVLVGFAIIAIFFILNRLARKRFPGLVRKVDKVFVLLALAFLALGIILGVVAYVLNSHILLLITGGMFAGFMAVVVIGGVLTADFSK